MKTFLLYGDQDFDLKQAVPANEAELTQDLDLATLVATMAQGDPFLRDVARSVVLHSLTDPAAIVYRQQVLTDSLEHPEVVRQMYDLAVATLQGERKIWGVFGKSPDALLHRSVQVLELLVSSLRRLRQIADEHASTFQSPGFSRFFAMLAHELDDDYFQTIDNHLRELKFPRGVLLSAQLGEGNKGTRYVLHLAHEQTWMDRLPWSRGSGYSFQIADRDEAGFTALAELRGRGINLVANALAQSTDHILSFFTTLRTELAFYIGCLNLHAQLTQKEAPVCVPVPVAFGERAFTAEGLYDVCLSLHLDTTVVGNDVDADDKSLVVVTGANQGGKSTFLRSVGLAQMMMQCGLFVGARSFRATICEGVFTHFKREEDATMTSGKLDEELNRMSEIAEHIRPGAILLCNESFASTNDREGSEIARQVVRAMVESGITVIFVTHLFDFAESWYRQRSPTALFLRAEREPDGRRTFRLSVGEPLPTSFGADAYERIFGTAPDTVPQAAESS